ncbi:hypothetical protein U8P76_23740 [Rhizobium johnstonii]|nr:hypothetical protein U8P76_23740 [Rhizobium johnstonii]
MQAETRKHWFGEFDLAGESIFGELTASGLDTNLYLQREKYFSPAAHNSRTIYGSLQDKRAVTLIDCNLPPTAGSSHSKKGSYRFANIFPHYVIFGDAHLNPEEPVVSRISWYLDDIDLAFYDFDAFGTALNPEKFIFDIVADHEKFVDRKIIIGPHPEIQYFAGRFEVFTCDIGFGTLSRMVLIRALVVEPRVFG